MDETWQDSAVAIEEMDFEGPFTSFILEDEQQQLYADLVSDFEEALNASTGSERDRENCVDKLVLLDEFINAVAEGNGLERSETIELLFNQQAASGGSTVTTYLDNIAVHELDALQEAHRQGRSAVLDRIKGGGAQILNEDRVFVQTAPERTSIGEGEGAGGNEINTYAPKFTEVITALLSSDINGEKIYYDDLVIHKGSVDPDMVRNRPYDVIQIPKINKEIAVCEILGEVMLVSPQIRGPEVYEKYKKHELENAFGMHRVEYRGDWQGQLIEAISGNFPENRSKVNITDFAKQQSSGKMPLSPDIIAIALLKYAAEHEGKMAALRTKDPVPDMDDENWKALDSDGWKGYRNIPKGMTLAAIKRYYGWNDNHNHIQKDKIKDDIHRFQATGELPEPVISIEEAIKVKEKPNLSIEIVGLALIKYAAAHEGKMATPLTIDPVPDMKDDNWSILNAVGRQGNRNMPKGLDLAAIKRYYGWNDNHNHIQKDKIKDDIHRFQATGELPEPVISIEEAIKVKEKPNLSIEIVGLALIKYAAAHEGKMVVHKTKEPVLDMEDETWVALDMAGIRGNRNMPKGMNFAAIKRYYGWNDNNNRIQKDKIKDDIQHLRTTGELPEPVISIEEAIKVKVKSDLSVEAMAIALLKYAALDEGKMATATTKDPVPDMEDETWSACDAAGVRGNRNMPEGMNLAAIKRYYGWLDENNRFQQDKIKADILHFQATGVLPELVMSMEGAIHGKDTKPEYDVLGL